MIMRRKEARVAILLFFFLFSLYSAHAGSMGDMLYDKLGWIARLDLSGASGGNEVAFWAKLILWLVLFAVLYYVGTTKVFTDRPRIAGVLAAAIALSVIAVPSELIKRVIQGYQIVGIVFLIALPVSAIFFLLMWLRKELAQEHPCFYHLASAIGIYLILVVMSNLGEAIKRTYSVFAYDNWFGFAFAVLELLMIYHIFMLFSCGKGTEGGERPAVGGGGWGNIGERIKNFLAPGRGGGGSGGGGSGRRLGPAPPPKTVLRRTPNKGDDPTPPKKPPTIEPPWKPVPGVKKHTPTKIQVKPEARVTVDLSSWFLPIRNQDSLGACAAFAGGSIIEYTINRQLGYVTDDYKLSELFLWYNTRAWRGGNSGTPLPQLLAQVRNPGVCKELHWSWEDSTSQKYLLRPHDAAYADAPSQRVLEVESLAVDADEWIAALAGEQPILIAISVPENFDDARGTKLFQNPQYPTSHSGHAMVIVGYDSHYPDGKKFFEAFKVRNSWGSGWGDGGYIWIPRNDIIAMVSKYASQVYVFVGWEKHLPKLSCKITGRCIFDDEDPRITENQSGKDIYDKQGDVFGKDEHGQAHKYKVGVLAQIKGKLEVLNEYVSSERSGRFVLTFEVNPGELEPLELLRSRHKALLNVNFAKLPAGVVVYKTEENGNALDFQNPHMWFHVVDASFSRGGRGGEGVQDPMNPCSFLLHTGLNCSGRPITFTDKHLEEDYVIVPIFGYGPEKQEKKGEQKKEEKKRQKKMSWDTKKTLKAVEKVERFAVKEARWIAPAYKYLYDMKEVLGKGNAQDIEKNLDTLKRDIELVGRAERVLVRFKKRMDKHGKKFVKVVPADYHTELEQLRRTLSVSSGNVLLYTSRYEGKIRKHFDSLKKVIESKRIAPAERTTKVAVIRREMIAFADDAIKWQSSIVVQLGKLEELCGRIAEDIKKSH